MSTAEFYISNKQQVTAQVETKINDRKAVDPPFRPLENGETPE
jgi:hypothetical protein